MVLLLLFASSVVLPVHSQTGSFHDAPLSVEKDKNPYAGQPAAVDAGNAVVVHQFSPGAVGKNHQFGDDFIQRRAALSGHDRNHIVLDIKIVIGAVVGFRFQSEAAAAAVCARRQPA